MGGRLPHVLRFHLHVCREVVLAQVDIRSCVGIGGIQLTDKISLHRL